MIVVLRRATRADRDAKKWGCTRKSAFTVLWVTIVALAALGASTSRIPVKNINKLSQDIVSYYRLRVEFSTTSDWAILEFSDASGLLTFRQMSTPTDPNSAQVSLSLISLRQSLDAANLGKSVNVTVDWAVNAASLDSPFEFVIRMGCLNSSTARFYVVIGNEARPVKQYDHPQTCYPYPNPITFSFDTTVLRTIQPRQSPAHSGDRMLWAIYYPWIGWSQISPCTDHPLPAYEYNRDGSRTIDTYLRAIDQAVSAGIDGFMVSWTDGGLANRDLSLLLDAAERRSFRIAIYLETTPDPKDRTLHPEVVQEKILFAIQTFGNRPAYMRIDGKPLVMIYNSQLAPLEVWRKLFANLEAAGAFGAYFAASYNLSDLELFVGLHQYAIIGMSDLAKVYKELSRVVRLSPLLADASNNTAKSKLFAATVQPGFDACPYGDQNPPLAERSNGEFFRRTFEAAYLSDPDWIIITSWNEFGENTHIEPSERYGDLYLRITREYAEKWKEGAVNSLYFPRLITNDGLASGSPPNTRTGIAIANLGSETAIMHFRAISEGGKEIDGAEITNPVSRSLDAKQQMALVDNQIFGPGLTRNNQVRWMTIASTVKDILGFFLVFDDDLSVLDGGLASSTTMTSSILPEIEAGGFTQIHLANPGPNIANVTLELTKSDGKLRTTGVTRKIDASGALASSLVDLFPGIAADRADYIKATSDKGIIPFELLGKSGKYVKGLNGFDISTGTTSLFAPQYVVGGDVWRTSLSVVNLEPKTCNITLKFRRDDGTQVGSTRSLPVGANGKVYIDDQRFFLDQGSSEIQGYLEIASDGPKIAGSLVFGDQSNSIFAAALPLATAASTGFLFGHVASNNTYFTGIAILNPGNADAAATLELFDATGSLTASKSLQIPGKRRLSRLITEYFPQVVERDIHSGYVKLTSNSLLASFAVFGTRSLSALAAIPAQPTSGR